MADLVERLNDVYASLTPGAIERADLDGMAFTVREAADRIAALEAEASEGERRGLERAAEVIADLSLANRRAAAANRGINRRAAVEAAKIWSEFEKLEKQIRALIPEAPAREGWQPIETAPRDRAILVYDTGQGRCIAYWAQWHDNLLGEDREGWRTMGDWERLDWVTHWMAIPGPPPPQDRDPDSQRGAK